jgi:hypothetical protein
VPAAEVSREELAPLAELSRRDGVAIDVDLDADG